MPFAAGCSSTNVPQNTDRTLAARMLLGLLLCRGPELNRRHMVLQVMSPAIREVAPQLARDETWLSPKANGSTKRDGEQASPPVETPCSRDLRTCRHTKARERMQILTCGRFAPWPCASSISAAKHFAHSARPNRARVQAIGGWRVTPHSRGCPSARQVPDLSGLGSGVERAAQCAANGRLRPSQRAKVTVTGTGLRTMSNTGDVRCT